mmetsp:Transcript_65345/g.142405  ORF Transcript_65345/g.142405 Transcript_65345/m.142405 type:complete len:333 (+) Transcript_65345:153-1151(+)
MRTRRRLADVAVNAHRRCHHGRGVPRVCRHNYGVGLLCYLLPGSDPLFCYSQCCRPITTRAHDGCAEHSDAFRICPCSLQRSPGLTLRAQDCSLTLPLCNVHLALLIALALQNLSAPSSLSLRLHLHGLPDARWWNDVAHLVAENLNTPGLRSIVDNGYNGRIEGITLLKGLVQCHLPNLRAHRCLGQLRNCKDGLMHSIGGLIGVNAPQVNDCIKAYGHIVPCNSLLVVNGDGLLFERVSIGNPVHDRNDEVQARIKHFVKATKALHDPGNLLRHHYNAKVPPGRGYAASGIVCPARRAAGRPSTSCKRLQGERNCPACCRRRGEPPAEMT